MDVFSRTRRSAIMARIKGRGNIATELRLVKILREHKIRGWRRGSRLIGKPDFVFPAARLAVFVDGCFWHGCPRHGQIPKSNRSFWLKKIKANVARDRTVRRNLKKLGWRVIRLWQHELSEKDKRRIASRILRSL
jgi:DNA mismatch endonuclease (patch repair protein)